MWINTESANASRRSSAVIASPHFGQTHVANSLASTSVRAFSQPTKFSRLGQIHSPQCGHGLTILESVEVERNVSGNSFSVVLVPSMYVARSAHLIERWRALNCSNGSASGLLDEIRLNAAASVTKMVRNV